MSLVFDPINGISGVPAIYENATVVPLAAGSVVNFDVLSQSVLQYTNSAASNWVLNIRGAAGVPLSSVINIGNAITVTFILRQGATPYFATGFTIDGVSYTPLWQGAAPTSGFANSTEIYTYAVIRTATGYNVFATRTRFA